MSIAAIIVAAGRGRRAGDGPPKQYRALGGRAMLAWSLEALAAHPRIDFAVAVIHPDDRADYLAAQAQLPPALRSRLTPPVAGGETRQHSVRLGLEALAAMPPEIALIHDAARPFPPASVIDAALDAIVLRGAAGACASLPLADTLRRATPDGLCAETVPRDGLWRAQTPQAFRFGPILEAHRRMAGRDFTDDADLARAAGLSVALSAGSEQSAKITTPEDFMWAERLLAPADIRVGQGFDVHAFGPNADGSTDHVMLCGLRVPHDTGLVGHSDADVGLHAATDAVLGAAALGDIGGHFPPSDPAWRGAASARFLAAAAEMARAAGGRLTALDVTLICERPKIGLHVPAMRARLAEIIGLEIGRVSVKATTTEGLGFTGRREGIAAMASATLVFAPGAGA